MARARMVPSELFDPATELGKSYELLCTAVDGGPLAGVLYLALWVRTTAKARFLAGGEELVAVLGRIGRELGAGPERLRAYLLAMERLGLVRLWASGGALYGEIVHFFDHNTVRADREAPCRIPEPPTALGRVAGEGPGAPYARPAVASLFHQPGPPPTTQRPRQEELIPKEPPGIVQQLQREYEALAHVQVPPPDWASIVPKRRPRGLDPGQQEVRP